MNILDGKSLALQIRTELKEEIKQLGITPGFAVLLIGDDPASQMYVSLKEKASAEIGIHFEKILLPQNIEEELVLAKIDELNRRKDIHGILVQLPLPPHLNEDRITQEIFPEKDGDGFHPKNIELLMAGNPRVIPNLIQGIIHLLQATGVSLTEKKTALLANSDIFAKPLAKILADHGMAVQSFIAQKIDKQKILTCDIIISVLGRPHAITKNMVKKGAIVIDVGTTRVDGKILGDVHPNVSEKASWLTPVPGGVGPLTVAYLLKNVVEAAKR
ncbi:MAG: tetrahydrofolate dehydrogenase/cyclohydrolase catalytic domain-containing protein [bacterium]|nr:tetrahydrofolate dehydrogenase/cyclohydrolase catalytic domain-containing protein [bacterium]